MTETSWCVQWLSWGGGRSEAVWTGKGSVAAPGEPRPCPSFLPATRLQPTGHSWVTVLEVPAGSDPLCSNPEYRIAPDWDPLSLSEVESRGCEVEPVTLRGNKDVFLCFLHAQKGRVWKPPPQPGSEILTFRKQWRWLLRLERNLIYGRRCTNRSVFPVHVCSM